jgi:CubicO group peptidase (beta-lactamase class C family)
MYRLGSITKTITATGLMLLVEEGRVDLDRPAVEYLPEDVRPRTYVGEPEDVTVRHLVNHRSGMPAYAESFYEDDPEGPRSLGETVRRYGIVVYPPGWSFIYCNLGYQMLGSIIAEVSGVSYAEFIEERVFAPLGMTESLVYGGQALSRPYAVNYTQALERIPLYVDVYPGADGNCASAHDLVRFAMFHLEDHLPGQEAILTDESIRSMQAAVPPSNTRYGIGWDLDASERGFRSVCHGGEGPGVDAFMRLFPNEDIAAVILCNAECEKLYDIQKAIFVALIPELGEPEPVEPQPVESESAGESPGTEPPAEPTGMYGTWAGRIEAYDRELEVELAIDSKGARVAVGDQPQDDMEVWVLSPTFLLGMFDASIPTADNERHPYRNRLAVVRDGDRLYGAVISVGSWEARAGHYELSSQVELNRLTRK